MQTLKSDIRNRILSAAKEQFVQRGYLKTSMREIADAVDVGVGNLYNYFENKDELFCVILRPVSGCFGANAAGTSWSQRSRYHAYMFRRVSQVCCR